MQTDNKLLTVAILGTQQQEVPPLSADGKLGQCLEELARESSSLGRERTVLQATALQAISQRAGRKLSKSDLALASPSLPEDKPVVSDLAASHLRFLLASQQDLLPEWLELTARLQKRMPDDCLVAVLQTAHQNKFLQPLAAACSGTRAQWLSELNSDWKFIQNNPSVTELNPNALKEKFELGDINERVFALSELRRIEPALGLELLTDSWQADRPEDRARFIAALETGLSMADEPFLEETALDDKRKEVRLQARERLLNLPQSRLRRRAEERAFACITASQEKAGGLIGNIIPFGKTRLELTATVPETCDKSMLRDGFVAKPPDSRLGEKAWWLCQMVSQVDSQRLRQHLGLSSEQLLEAVRASTWQLALSQGLSASALRFNDKELARLLLQDDKAENPEKLFALLDKDEQEQILSAELEKRGFLLIRQEQSYHDMQSINRLMQLNHQWSSAFSQIILKTVRNHIAQKNAFIFMEYIMRHVGKHFDVELWAGVQESWSTMGKHDAALERMIWMLSFRKEMRDALEKSS